MCVTVAGGNRGGVGGHKLFCHLAGGGGCKIYLVRLRGGGVVKILST